jgi:hypothetical protein
MMKMVMEMEMRKRMVLSSNRYYDQFHTFKYVTNNLLYVLICTVYNRLCVYITFMVLYIISRIIGN